MSGTFTTGKDSEGKNVPLDRVQVFAFPANATGGLVAAESTTTAFDNTKMTWGPISITTNVYAGKYAIRADGRFTGVKGEVGSAYKQATATGNNAPVPAYSLIWQVGSPNSPKANTISGEGIGVGTLAKMPAPGVLATAELGGPHFAGTFDFDPVNKSKWVMSDITVPGGTKYTVTAVIVGSDGKVYSTPFQPAVTVGK